MRIISKWTDYYDYMAHVYGHDDRPVYTRGEIAQTEVPIYSASYLKLPDFYFHLGSISLRWVCVCGRVYTQWREIGSTPWQWRWIDDPQLAVVFERESQRLRYIFNRRIKPEDFMGVESELALRVSREIQQSVFIITQVKRDRYGHSTVTVQDRVPDLSELGVASFIAPDQMYQDLEYFIANTMQPSPDTTVTDNQTDPEKIVGHGFDLKQSFRHRK